MCKVNILGEVWSINEGNEKEDATLRDSDGYCDHSCHKIVITDGSEHEIENFEGYRKKTIRHELTHAFLYESGLHVNSSWAANEEMVDWIAIQFPKMLAVFKELGVET